MTESTGSPEHTETGVAALQATLAAEHAAVFVYGALGARTSQSSTPALYRAVSAAYAVHRERRDHLMALVHAAGEKPVGAEPGYGLPALDRTAAVKKRAVALEEAAAATYAPLVASSTGEVRAWAIQALLDAAVRGLRFGAVPTTLPGLSDA